MSTEGLFFVAPNEIEIREMEVRPPEPGKLLIKTLVSAISPGTELLIYRGEAPRELAADASITSLKGSLVFPMQYGYAAVGKVIEVGQGLDHVWINQIVFSFQPHQTHFNATPDQVMVLPEGISREAAAFLPNMETAVNFLMDGRPLIGERVAVFGQGIVGLLTTALLALFPLEDLLTLDKFPNRRMASMEAGATRSIDPTDDEILPQVGNDHGFDLVYELSGSPAALDQAIGITGFSGRVVIGSWYGQKHATLDLGSYFHRSRIRLISSQVSSIAPDLRGRWDKSRRFELVWEMIRQVQPERWITHRLPFQNASRGYKLLDQQPGETIQVLLDYE
jgi:2-desacetyl-2-hydroxyethyl bacteriochlorophyllide A dehydrogenase